jgi:hypothetical protein
MCASILTVNTQSFRRPYDPRRASERTSDGVTRYGKRLPLRRHESVGKERGDGGCQDLSVVAIFRLEVASIDERIELTWVHLDLDHLPAEFSPPAKESHSLSGGLRPAYP